jgi:hypothetical protein
MSRYDQTVNNGTMEAYSKMMNNARTQDHYQSIYRNVWSDPITSGRAAIKISQPENYYGIDHFIPTPQRQLYNTPGLPTGRGVDPLPPLKFPKLYSMSG